MQSRTFRRIVEPLIWITPAFCFVFCFTHIPIVLEGVLSLFDADGFAPPRLVGGDNYVELFSNGDFWEALSHNLIYAVVTVVGKIAVSLLLAIILNQKILGRSFFRTFLFLPVVLSFVAIGVIWTLVLNFNYGILNGVLHAFNLDSWRRDWLGDAGTAMGAIIFVDLWKWCGFHLVIYLAGLQSLPRDLYDAAALDGANRWQQFWFLTLPLVRPFTAINVLLASLGAFSVFDLVYVMTQGGPFKATNVAMIEIYLQAFQFNRLGYAAAMSVVLLILVAGVSIFILRLNKSRLN